MTNNSKMPMVSIIIPNYNYAQYVAEAVHSALEQTYKSKEIIVINNGSTDNSMQILKSFGSKIYIVDQQNLGQSGARNTGILHAKGELVAFLDADDVWEPLKLEKQISLLSEETGLVYCGISVFQNSISTGFEKIRPSYRGNCHDYFLLKPGLSIVLAGESTAVFRKSLIDKVGVFDQNLNSSAGWDFFRRCSAETKFDFTPEFLVHHRNHEMNMSNSVFANIEDMWNSFFKMVPESVLRFGIYTTVKTFVTYGWSTIKTFTKHRSPLLVWSIFSKTQEFIVVVLKSISKT